MIIQTKPQQYVDFSPFANFDNQRREFVVDFKTSRYLSSDEAANKNV